jgi:hypothetical protein
LEYASNVHRVQPGISIGISVGPVTARADGGIGETLAKGPGGEQQASAAPPVTIFTARKIVTMERTAPAASAIAIAGKRILAVGSLDEVKAAVGTRPYTMDETFASRIVLPALIDQHLHPILGALTLAVEVIAIEDRVLPGRTLKAANSQPEYRDRLKAAEARIANPDEWLLTWGYHSLWHGKLDRAALDGISTTRPIAVWQRSCHEFYLNTAGLKALGLTEAMTNCKGLASEQVDWDHGHFRESGLNLMTGPMLKMLATPDRLLFGLKQMVSYLHANGVTAYNEPGALYTPDMWKLYEQVLGAPDTPMYSTFLADGRGIPDRVGLDRALDATEEQIAVAPEGPGQKLMFFPCTPGRHSIPSSLARSVSWKRPIRHRPASAEMRKSAPRHNSEARAALPRRDRDPLPAPPDRPYHPAWGAARSPSPAPRS